MATESHKKSTYKNSSLYQLNCQAILSTMVMVVGGKYTTTCLDILVIPGVKFNIVHPVIKVVYDKTG